MTTSGCDSIFELTLNVNPDYSFAESATICSGNTYLWHSNNYTTAGLYYDSLLTTAGCDSIFELTLNVNPTYLTQDVADICNGGTYIWHSNNYTSAGIYYDSLLTMSGCDSIFELTLNVTPGYFFAESNSICNGNTYSWHSNNYRLCLV